MTPQPPAQQSVAEAHISPKSPQKEEGAQTLLAHRAEQQSEPVTQAFPSVLQYGFRGVHMPFGPHAPPQHWRPAEQGRPSEVQADTVQRPPAQAWLQQSFEDPHVTPNPRHALIAPSQ